MLDTKIQTLARSGEPSIRSATKPSYLGTTKYSGRQYYNLTPPLNLNPTMKSLSSIVSLAFFLMAVVAAQEAPSLPDIEEERLGDGQVAKVIIGAGILNGIKEGVGNGGEKKGSGLKAGAGKKGAGKKGAGKKGAGKKGAGKKRFFKKKAGKKGFFMKSGFKRGPLRG